MASLLRAAKRLSRPFFNRSEEMRGLERMLTGGDGKLVLVTGPRNSGKSALLQQFMDWQVEHERGHPILVDMRSGQYSTASSFASELKVQSTSVFLPAATAVLSRLSVQGVAKEGLEGLVDGLKAYMDAVENATQTDMMKLLKALEGLFLNWAAIARRYGHGMEAAYPTLVIDEANMLDQWSLTLQEQQHLWAFMNWLIMITKQMGVANVILCSSEDCFRFWMNTQLGDDRYLVGIVGDLTEEEALEFFKQQLLLDRPSKFAQSYKVPDCLWKEIYAFFGGRMNTLKLLASELAWGLDDENEMVSIWQRFKHPWWTKALADVKAGFDPANIEEKWVLPVLGARVSNLQEAPGFTIPLWIPEEYEALLGEMAEAKEGVLSVDSLLQRKVINKKAIYSLIQHNLLHYRDVGYWGGRDLMWYTGEYPIVMPTSRSRFCAVQSIVQGLKKP